MYNCPSVRLSQAGRSTQAAERIELVVGVKASFPLILHGILHHSIYTVKHITDAARIVLDSGAEGPGFKSQSRRCRVTVLSKLFTPIVPLFTKQKNWQQPC